MIYLVISTAHPEAHVAIVREGNVVATTSWTADRTLSTKVLTAVADLLQETKLSSTQIDTIVIHRGPGHFSALRTGVVVATMLATAWDVPLLPVTGTTLQDLISAASQATPSAVVQPDYGA